MSRKELTKRSHTKKLNFKEKRNPWFLTPNNSDLPSRVKNLCKFNINKNDIQFFFKGIINIIVFNLTSLFLCKYKR